MTEDEFTNLKSGDIVTDLGELPLKYKETHQETTILVYALFTNYKGEERSFTKSNVLKFGELDDPVLEEDVKTKEVHLEDIDRDTITLPATELIQYLASKLEEYGKYVQEIGFEVYQDYDGVDYSLVGYRNETRYEYNERLEGIEKRMLAAVKRKETTRKNKELLAAKKLASDEISKEARLKRYEELKKEFGE